MHSRSFHRRRRKVILVPRPRKDVAQDTRARALWAARTLLQERGYLGVSLDDVARAVGVRQASLYHHFPGGKEELVLGVAREAIDHDAAGIERTLREHAAARTRLTALATFLLSSSVRTGRMLQESLRFVGEAHQERVYADFYAREYLPVRRVFDEGVSSGELRPHDTRRSAWAFLDLVEQLGTNPEERGTDDLAEWIVDLLLNGLRA